ncbi:MAG: thioredoxin family protein [Candidatus Thorarchaeota archaeon]
MVQEVSASQISNIVAENRVVFIDCYATWCQPCKMLAPTLESLDEKYRDRGFKVVKIDVDKNREFSSQNRISGVPTVLVYNHGERVVFDNGQGHRIDRLVGVLPEEIYVDIIEGLLGEDKTN